MECRVCRRCAEGISCPVELESVDPAWGSARIRNLMAGWHNQLLEIMGAMGMREVRRLRGEMGRAMFFEDLEKEFAAWGKEVEQVKAKAKAGVCLSTGRTSAIAVPPRPQQVSAHHKRRMRQLRPLRRTLSLRGLHQGLKAPEDRGRAPLHGTWLREECVLLCGPLPEKRYRAERQPCLSRCSGTSAGQPICLQARGTWPRRATSLTRI